MLDGVVLEYNPTSGEGIVEIIHALSYKRYSVSVPFPTHKSAQQSTARYMDYLLNSTPVGRCVTIVPEVELSAAENLQKLPLARFVHFHESNILTSKSMLPGTISRIAGRFVFIFCLFLPYEAVATRDMFSTSGALTDLVNPLSSDDEEASQWIGRSVQFALQPKSFLVMEAFFASSDGDVDARGHPANAARGLSRAAPLVQWTNPSPGLLQQQQQQQSGMPDAQLGAWHITGADPSYFFQPEVLVRLSHAKAGPPLPDNAVPPLLYQGDIFTIELWCFWVLGNTRVTLHALDEDMRDVTNTVLCIEEKKDNEINGRAAIKPVTLDCLESRAVVTFSAKVRTFKLRDAMCELTLVLRAELDGRGTQLRSRPLFVRRRGPKAKVRAGLNEKAPYETDELSRKFWTSDVLTPKDSIVAGFTDPGRSNQLLGPSAYEEMPMVEREVIVIDPNDQRLQDLAVAARRAKIGIVDIVSQIQTLLWLVVSALGGVGVGEHAENEIASLRRDRLTAKRRRNSTPGAVNESDTNDKEKSSSNAVGVNVVRLGDVRNGVCRHRALLFKYLCDVVHLPCYLLRGEHKSPQDTHAERHSWNVVPLDGRRYVLVDATLSPHKLKTWPDPEYRAPPAEFPSDWAGAHCMILTRPTGRIRLLEECGRGSTAVVRRGLLCGGLTCVVKVPRRGGDIPGLVHEYEVLRCFRGATRVVQCLGWSGGVVMEYMPITLLSFMNHLIIREKRMSLSQQKQVLVGVLIALQEVHDRGFIHRDIKAENILAVVIRCSTCQAIGTICHLCDLRVKLGDFADCVAVRQGTRIHLPVPRVGTVPYAAPEVEAEAPFTTAADIWACGILAIEMAQMRLPQPTSKVGNDEEEAAAAAADPDGELVTVSLDGRVIGPVRVPRLPCSPTPQQWQRHVVDGALRVDWRERCTAAQLLELIDRASL